MKSDKPRLPRGARPVAEAFLTALDAIPAHSRPDVAKASLGIVREGLAQRKDAARQKAASAKIGKKPVAATRAASTPSAQPAPKGALPKANWVPARKRQASKPKLTVVPAGSVA